MVLEPLPPAGRSPGYPEGVPSPRGSPQRTLMSPEGSGLIRSRLDSLGSSVSPMSARLSSAPLSPGRRLLPPLLQQQQRKQGLSRTALAGPPAGKGNVSYDIFGRRSIAEGAAFEKAAPGRLVGHHNLGARRLSKPPGARHRFPYAR